MFIRKVRLVEREMLFKARIKELENIICHGEQHDYAIADEKTEVYDGRGSTVYHRRYVCKRCLKAVEKTDVI